MNYPMNPKHTRLTALILLPLVLGSAAPASLRADSPFTGFYSGFLHVRVSGAVNVPESPIGPVFYTVDADGNLSGSGQGNVDAAGQITWQSNDLSFTTGSISGSVLSAQSSVDSGGATTTYRIEAKNNATGFGTGSTVAQGFTWRLPSPVGGVMRGVTHGDGKFVAIGPGGTVAVSGNGSDWVPAFTPTSVRLNAVAHGKGTFVAVGDAASVFTSPDGTTWTPRSLNADLVKQNMAGVAFGAGTFVAVNIINEVYTSPDGALWTKIGSAPTGVTTWSNLKFVGGRFVLVGNLTTRGAIATSADGLNWSPTVTLASTGGILDVAYGNGKWVGVNLTRHFTFTAPDASDAVAGPFNGLGDAVGFVNGTFVSDNRYFSADGTNWRRETYPNLDINDMVTAGDRLVAVGGAMTSTMDGRNWLVHSAVMPAATVNGTYSHLLGNGTVTGDVFAEIEYYVQGSPRWLRMGVGGLIAERVSGASGFAAVASPTARTLRGGFGSSTTAVGVGDGGTIVRFGSGANAWTNVPSGTTANLTSVSARNGNPLVVVGQAGTILRSTDGGQTWSQVSSGTGQNLNRVEYLSGTGFNFFLAVGDHGTLLRSADGTTWNALESGTTKSLVGAARLIGGNVNVLVLARDSLAQVSEDRGNTWRTVPVNAPYPLVLQVGAVGYGEGGFTMTTQNSNGTNWTYSLPNVRDLSSAAFGAGRFVVLSSGHWHVSTDLQRWQTIPSDHTHEGIAYGGGQFVSVGLGESAAQPPTGYVSTSPDGLRWTHRTTPTSVILKGVAYGLGRYVAVGQNGTILSSTDGITWVNRTIAGTQELKSVAYGNGRFVAVGVSGALRHSADGETWTSSGSGTSSTLWSVTHGNGLFVAVGDDARIRTSTNGIAWTARTTAPTTSRTFRTVRYAGGRFIAMGEPDGNGNGAVLAHSQDGVAWVKEIAIASEAINAMAAGNGTFIAVGNNGTLLAANYQDTNSPLVTVQPTGKSLNAGQTLHLTATVVGAQPISYRWLRNGTSLSNGGNISGADTASLTITGVGEAEAGEYVLEAVNDQGGRRSLAALVTVGTTVNQNFTQWLADKGLTPGINDGPDLDPDGDGIPTLGEFAFGTHPNRADSVSIPQSVTVNVDGTDYPAVRFQRNRRAADITLTVEAFVEVTSAGSVVTTALPPVDLGDDVEQVTVHAASPLGAITTLFFHLKLATP